MRLAGLSSAPPAHAVRRGARWLTANMAESVAGPAPAATSAQPEAQDDPGPFGTSLKAVEADPSGRYIRVGYKS